MKDGGKIMTTEEKVRAFLKNPRKVLTVIGAVIALCIVSSCFFVVDQAEQAVITRFG